MDDGVQAMLDQLNTGFPRVENMIGPQARAAVAERRVPVNNLDDVESATDRCVPGPDGAIPVRIYRPHGEPSGDRAAIVFYHGGGFVFCDIESHDGFCRALARGSQAVRGVGRLPACSRTSRARRRARRVHGVLLGGRARRPSWVSIPGVPPSPATAPAAISPRSPRSCAATAASPNLSHSC